MCVGCCGDAICSAKGDRQGRLPLPLTVGVQLPPQRVEEEGVNTTVADISFPLPDVPPHPTTISWAPSSAVTPHHLTSHPPSPPLSSNITPSHYTPAFQTTTKRHLYHHNRLFGERPLARWQKQSKHAPLSQQEGRRIAVVVFPPFSLFVVALPSTLSPSSFHLLPHCSATPTPSRRPALIVVVTLPCPMRALASKTPNAATTHLLGHVALRTAVHDVEGLQELHVVDLPRPRQVDGLGQLKGRQRTRKDTAATATTVNNNSLFPVGLAMVGVVSTVLVLMMAVVVMMLLVLMVVLLMMVVMAINVDVAVVVIVQFKSQGRCVQCSSMEGASMEAMTTTVL